MLVLLIFFVINGAYASESSYSLLKHFNVSTVQQRECPPLFYGPQCTIPYCFPSHGVLAQKGDHYYCSCICKQYVWGIHCENIECQNDGRFSNLTSECECPHYTYGHFCQLTLLQIVFLVLMFSSFIIGMFSFNINSPCRKRWTPSEINPNPSPIQDFYKLSRYISERIQHYWRIIHERFQHCWHIISARLQHYRDRITFYTGKVFTRKPNDSTNPAPDVRIVERIVHRDTNAHRDAPPTLAMYSELPTYETAADSVEPPKYTD
uniref:EGF-like domain-containing protein n=1 Tax=Panagrellus redivivus TaxID=6233 RepID=A0A7E4ZUT1_PANRE